MLYEVIHMYVQNWYGAAYKVDTASKKRIRSCFVQGQYSWQEAGTEG